MACSSRTYPLRQPPNHQPPVPRWRLVLPEGVTRIFTAYIGIQPRAPVQAQPQSVDANANVDVDVAARTALQKTSDEINAWLQTPSRHAAQAVERFRVEQGDDVEGGAVWVCYWDDEARGKRALRELDLWSVYGRCLSEEEQQVIGLWSESFSTAAARLETNYSGADYRPGVAGLPGTRTEAHRMTAYWGAARDRIPASAEDLFEGADAADTPPRSGCSSSNSAIRIVATNPDNTVHIRSGQFWHACGPDERAAYHLTLQPRLLSGLHALRAGRRATGAMGLRFLRNQPLRHLDDADGAGADSHPEHPEHPPRGETSVAAFFRSLRHLEAWASQHPAHLAIYAGAMRHAKRFGDARALRTWHEVSVLKAGDATFEYIHCVPGTGVLADTADASGVGLDASLS
ncbi:hypothetical protein E4U43_004480 [Claviceps pusilla]|uniref:Phenylacetaldoxime dehydratase n=1 Tax=Claviceps pusilla TaxID=123648 RepID=A0A9P7N3C8_9HYPO|nr:hypothetical protein E4U43_004480 [Claviceps pusilla]